MKAKTCRDLENLFGRLAEIKLEAGLLHDKDRCAYIGIFGKAERSKLMEKLEVEKHEVKDKIISILVGLRNNYNWQALFSTDKPVYNWPCQNQ